MNINSEPYGLFSLHIPDTALAENGHLHHLRERQGLVPDLLINFPNSVGNMEFLGEIKLLSAGKTWYHSKRKSVDIRAERLPKEYKDKAHNIDKIYNGVSDDQVGPVESKLQSFGNIQGLVVGQFSECSQDLHNLLLNFADEKVLNLSRSKGIYFGADTRSLVIQQIRRRFSVCATRAQSACLLSRLGHFSEGARLGAQRRAHFKSREEVIRQDLRSHFDAFVRGRRLKRAGLLHI